MIMGIGTDILRIDRVSESISRRILGDRETKEFEAIKDKKTYLAARFAAKEAFFKALGTGLRDYSFKAIEVIHNKLKKPLFLFHTDFSFNFVHLTITHDYFACAHVVLEKRVGQVYIGIGSNIGNRLRNIQRACDLLELSGLKIIRKSSVYETLPYGVTEQPKFYNCVVEVDVKQKPQELLQTLLHVEQTMGRSREKRWGPRIIDLDILLFGNIIYESTNLVIPHYDMLNRQFVIVPLLELGVIEHPLEGDFRYLRKEGEECILVTKNW